MFKKKTLEIYEAGEGLIYYLPSDEVALIVDLWDIVVIFDMNHQAIKDLVTVCNWDPNYPDMNFMDRYGLEDVDIFASVSNYSTFIEELESIGVIQPNCAYFYKITNNRDVHYMLQDFIL